jgi:hypothetical protein
MAYSENQKGEVLLTMSRADYDVLLMALGSAMSVSRSDRGVPLSILIPTVNRLMHGNPNWTPYQERQECILNQGIFDRWFIGHPKLRDAAWSGSRWVPCGPMGEPTGGVQVCNFETEQEAREYCREHSLEPQ